MFAWTRIIPILKTSGTGLVFKFSVGLKCTVFISIHNYWTYTRFFRATLDKCLGGISFAWNWIMQARITVHFWRNLKVGSSIYEHFSLTIGWLDYVSTHIPPYSHQRILIELWFFFYYSAMIRHQVYPTSIWIHWILFNIVPIRIRTALLRIEIFEFKAVSRLLLANDFLIPDLLNNHRYLIIRINVDLAHINALNGAWAATLTALAWSARAISIRFSF